MCLISSISIILIVDMRLDLGVTGWNAIASGRAKGIERIKVIDIFSDRGYQHPSS